MFLRIGLIGSGRAGMIHARNFISSVPQGRLVAICDAFEETAKAAAEELGLNSYETDYMKIINRNDIDAVVIATPTKYHCEIAIAAAKAKKHILCEKPMAMNVEECDLMIKAAEENGVNLQIGFMRRFDQSFVAAKKLVDEGRMVSRWLRLTLLQLRFVKMF